MYPYFYPQAPQNYYDMNSGPLPLQQRYEPSIVDKSSHNFGYDRGYLDGAAGFIYDPDDIIHRKCGEPYKRDAYSRHPFCEKKAQPEGSV